MPRKPRIHYLGALYHVILSGNARKRSSSTLPIVTGSIFCCKKESSGLATAFTPFVS